MEESYVQDMLKKLDDLYSKKRVLQIEMEQTQEGIEFLQTLLMFKYNEDKRKKEKEVYWTKRVSEKSCKR